MPLDPFDVCRCGHIRSASIHHESYTRPNRCTFDLASSAPSDLAIRLETLTPHPDRYPTHLYAAKDRCGRCNTLTIVLRIEPVYPDVDVAGRDVDCTMHFCPVCLEQLTREVRSKAGEFATVPA